MDLTDEEAQLIRGKIEALKVEHRDLDDIIERIARDPNLDELHDRSAADYCDYRFGD